MKKITVPKSLILEAGASDEVHCWQDGDGYIVLSFNPMLGYIGADVYDPGETRFTHGIFFQNDWDIKTLFGKKPFNLTPRQMLNRILPYLEI
jgi:hypothetical protein